jgi:hypothetical protein
MATYDQHVRFSGLAGRSKYRPAEGWFDVREYKLVPGAARRCVVLMDGKDERLVRILAVGVGGRVFASVVVDTAVRQGQRVRFTMTDVIVAKVAHGERSRSASTGRRWTTSSGSGRAAGTGATGLAALPAPVIHRRQCGRHGRGAHQIDPVAGPVHPRRGVDVVRGGRAGRDAVPTDLIPDARTRSRAKPVASLA